MPSNTFQDDSGNNSSYRVIMFLWIVVVAIVWGIVSIKGPTLADIPSGVMYLTMFLIGGKQVQKWLELTGGSTNIKDIISKLTSTSEKPSE